MSYITEKVQVMEDRTTGIQCDVCKKVFGANEQLFYFHTNHHDWGNDSVDSYEYFHTCTPECFKVILGNFVKKYTNSRTAEIAEMPIEFAKKLYDSLK